jgi:hypothetical protein
VAGRPPGKCWLSGSRGAPHRAPRHAARAAHCHRRARRRRHPPGPLPPCAAHPGRPHRPRLSPLEFLTALSRLIPPPWVHRHRYHGVLAPNARLRERVINLGRDDAEAPGDMASSPGSPAGNDRPREAGTAAVGGAAVRSRWARLLQSQAVLLRSATAVFLESCRPARLSSDPQSAAPSLRRGAPRQL